MKIDYPEIDFYVADISDENILNLGKKFDTVVCINVLEHIKNDEKALENMFRILLQGGNLLLFVPAIPQLYGSLDIDPGHFRRYTKKMLTKRISHVGFQIKKIEYSNFLGVFGWYLNARILKRRRFSVLQPLLFDKIVPLIAKIEKILKPPVGMSLFVIAERL
jgi:SAM-dependent methyltransferase